MRKKEQTREPPCPPRSPSVAVVEEVADDSPSGSSNHQVISVMSIVTDSPVLEVVRVGGKPNSALALLDTGSPVSFISVSAFIKFFASSAITLKTPSRSYNAVNNIAIPLSGCFLTSVELKQFPNISLTIDLLVLENNNITSDIIIGRDFLSNHRISTTIVPGKSESRVTSELFSVVASTDVVENFSFSLSSYLSDVKIDFNDNDKTNLINVV